MILMDINVSREKSLFEKLPRVQPINKFYIHLEMLFLLCWKARVQNLNEYLGLSGMQGPGTLRWSIHEHVSSIRNMAATEQHLKTQTQQTETRCPIYLLSLISITLIA